MIKQVIIILLCAYTYSAKAMFRAPTTTTHSKTLKKIDSLICRKLHEGLFDLQNQHGIHPNFRQTSPQYYSHQPIFHNNIAYRSITSDQRDAIKKGVKECRVIGARLMLTAITLKLYYELVGPEGFFIIPACLFGLFFLLNEADSLEPDLESKKEKEKIEEWLALSKELLNSLPQEVYEAITNMKDHTIITSYFLNIINQSSNNKIIVPNDPELCKLISTSYHADYVILAMLKGLILNAHKNNQTITFSDDFFEPNALFNKLQRGQEELLLSINDPNEIANIIEKHGEKLKPPLKHILKQQRDALIHNKQALPAY